MHYLAKKRKHEKRIFSLKCCITALPELNQSLLDFFNVVELMCLLNTEHRQQVLPQYYCSFTKTKQNKKTDQL